MAFYRTAIGPSTLLAALSFMLATALAHDETKYPDWSGQWRRPPGVGVQWDETKPIGLGQKAPLTPEYQAKLEWSINDQREGGQGLDMRYTCITNGMPRIMTFIRPVEFIVLPNVTYLHYENIMPRRIFTDGRRMPEDEEPTYIGYSIGQWLDTDGDGRFDTLEIETRNFKGPRTMEPSGLPLHEDNQTIVTERIYLDKANKDLMLNEITVIDHAFTQPWTVTKHYQRIPNDRWYEDNCAENNNHIIVGKENYFMSGDGYLMPARKDQAPPDLRYFKQTRK
ncbi:MAG TPA: hypothetical protein VKP67_18155 [Xanthobacteraceae bacterium]|nr:hypothetical protein [Xanthobacteraceae bacterium]